MTVDVRGGEITGPGMVRAWVGRVLAWTGLFKIFASHQYPILEVVDKARYTYLPGDYVKAMCVAGGKQIHLHSEASRAAEI